jgi:acid phosphatase type 7
VRKFSLRNHFRRPDRPGQRRHRHVGTYGACVVLACLTAILIAVPVFGQTAPVTLVGAGDIARCDASYDEQTAQLIGNTLASLSSPVQVITLGDNAYSSGTRAQFANCYDNYKLSDGNVYDSSRKPYAWWGQYKDRTMPSLGNHEYLNSTDPSLQSNPYFDYFSAQNGFKLPAAPVPNTTDNPGLTKGKGYYSYNLGSWHIVVLNSNCDYVSCDNTSTSAQATWLKDDLATHPAQCTLAYMHHPLYATGTGGLEPRVKPLWQILYNNGADVILNGHDHRYERLARIDPNDNPDPNYGIRPIIAGTGGDPGNGTTDTNEPNSQVKIFGTAGILRMDLSDGYYSWAFIAADGTANGKVMDSTANPADPKFGAENPPNSTNPAGTEACHGAPGGAGSTLAAPSNLTAARSGTLSKQRIDLSWTDNSTNEKNFAVQRSTDKVNWSDLASLPFNTTSYRDIALQRTTTYYYRVYAVDSAGTRSAPSNVASATTK